MFTTYITWFQLRYHIHKKNQNLYDLIKKYNKTHQSAYSHSRARNCQRNFEHDIHDIILETTVDET